MKTNDYLAQKKQKVRKRSQENKSQSPRTHVPVHVTKDQKKVAEKKMKK